MRPIRLFSLLGLVLATTSAAQVDVSLVFPVGSGQAPLAEIVAPANLRFVSCTKAHCVVNTTSTTEAASLHQLEAEGRVSIQPLPDAPMVYFQGGRFDARKRAFLGVPQETPAAGEQDPFATSVVVYRAPVHAAAERAILARGAIPLFQYGSFARTYYLPRSALPAIAESDSVMAAAELPIALKRLNLDRPAVGDGGGEARPTNVALLTGVGSKAIPWLKERLGEIPNPSMIHDLWDERERPGVHLVTMTVSLTRDEARALAEFPEVASVERQASFAASDEFANAVVAGGPVDSGATAWPADGVIPAMSPFWTSFVASLGQRPGWGSNFQLNDQVIGFLDTGVDTGLKTCTGGCSCPPAFRATTGVESGSVTGCGPNESCKLIYVADVSADHGRDLPNEAIGEETNARRANDYYYHGTLSTAIAAGLRVDPTNWKDNSGWAFNLGVAPGARVAMTKILRNCRADAGTTAVFRPRTNMLGEPDFQNEYSLALVRYALTAMGGGPGASSVLPARDGNNSPRPGARIFNHSWAELTVGYTSIAQFLDAATVNVMAASFNFGTIGAPNYRWGAIDKPSLHVVAAGNGPKDGDVIPPATAKNVITVGATFSDNRATYFPGCAENAPETQTNYRRVTTFSRIGWPPAAGAQVGRIKPDLVAPGTRMYGPRSRTPYFCGYACNMNIQSSKGDFVWGHGTSFAAPMVTGAAALVREWLFALYGVLDPLGYADPPPSLIKAILVATATNLCPTNNCPLADGQLMRSIPDRYQGFGGLSLSRLFGASNRYAFKTAAVNDPNLLTYTGPVTYVLHVTDPAKPVSIALAWDDAAAAVNTSAANVLINDLDLKATVELPYQPPAEPVLAEYRGNVYGPETSRNGYSIQNPGVAYIDRRNNVEKIDIPPNVIAPGGIIYVQVSPFAVPVTPVGRPPVVPDGYYGLVCEKCQQFSLAVENAH